MTAAKFYKALSVIDQHSYTLSVAATAKELPLDKVVSVRGMPGGGSRDLMKHMAARASEAGMKVIVVAPNLLHRDWSSGIERLNGKVEVLVNDYTMRNNTPKAVNIRKNLAEMCIRGDTYVLVDEAHGGAYAEELSEGSLRQPLGYDLWWFLYRNCKGAAVRHRINDLEQLTNAKESPILAYATLWDPEMKRVQLKKPVVSKLPGSKKTTNRRIGTKCLLQRHSGHPGKFVLYFGKEYVVIPAEELADTVHEEVGEN